MSDAAPVRRPQRQGDDDDDDGDGADEQGDDDDESDEQDDDSDDEEEQDDGYVYLRDSDIPDGFGSVVMSDPVAFIPVDALGDNHGIMVCCDDLEWMLGKIVKYKPRAAKYQFDIEWATGVTRQQQVDLEKYFLHASGETPVSGSWFYLKWARSAEGTEPRRRGRGDGDETAEMETEGKDEDEDDDDQGDGDESEA